MIWCRRPDWPNDCAFAGQLASRLRSSGDGLAGVDVVSGDGAALTNVCEISMH
jgi:hypothetical protein